VLADFSALARRLLTGAQNCQDRDSYLQLIISEAEVTAAVLSQFIGHKTSTTDRRF
jgi:hypothetical protein